LGIITLSKTEKNETDMAFSLMLHPHGATRLGDVLVELLADEQWTEFRAAIAFVKRSGTKHVRDPLAAFARRGGRVKISAGIDAGGTSREGLEDLLTAIDGRGELYVFKNANSSTFHPKLFLFRNDVAARLLIGSGNLTEGGLYTNYEAGVIIALAISDAEQAALLGEVEAALNAWSTPLAGNCYLVDNELLRRLTLDGWIPDEAYARGVDIPGNEHGRTHEGNLLFSGVPVPRAPAVYTIASSPSVVRADDSAANLKGTATTAGVIAQQPQAQRSGDLSGLRERVFLMTLQNTDVGVGQVRPGKQRRSAEVFIPLVCRDHDPKFWGWPSLFVEDASYVGRRDAQGRGKMDRANVRIRIGEKIVNAVFWYNPNKKDVRIRSEDLRSAGKVGDILYMKTSGDPGFDYHIEVISQGTPHHQKYSAMCKNIVRNSLKRWVYL
jgi:HKD family nuclease